LMREGSSGIKELQKTVARIKTIQREEGDIDADSVEERQGGEA